MPISYVGQLVAASKGIRRTDPDMYNPFAMLLYKQEAKFKVDVAAAKTFLELATEKRLPTWVTIQADVKLIEAAAT